MTGLQIGAVIGTVIVSVLGLILDRRDKRKAAEREIQSIPDNPAGLARFQQWVRDTKDKADRGV